MECDPDRPAWTVGAFLSRVFVAAKEARAAGLLMIYFKMTNHLIRPGDQVVEVWDDKEGLLACIYPGTDPDHRAALAISIQSLHFAEGGLDVGKKVVRFGRRPSD